MPEFSEKLESILNGNMTPQSFRWFERAKYREAARECLRVLYAIDEIMAHSRAPERDWQQISLALGLPSARYLELTEARIGRRFGISPMAVSKSVTKLLRLAELKPNGRGYNGMNHRCSMNHER